MDFTLSHVRGGTGEGKRGSDSRITQGYAQGTGTELAGLQRRRLCTGSWTSGRGPGVRCADRDPWSAHQPVGSYRGRLRRVFHGPAEIKDDVFELALKKADTENGVGKAIQDGMTTSEAFVRYGVLKGCRHPWFSFSFVTPSSRAAGSRWRKPAAALVQRGCRAGCRRCVYCGRAATTSISTRMS
jgi:hypothetical protein